MKKEGIVNFLIGKAVGLAVLLAAVLPLAGFGSPSEITVDLRLDNDDWVVNERVRGVVDIVNMSPDEIRVGYKGAPDRFFVEVFRASSREQVDPTYGAPDVAEFLLKPNDGQKLETFLGDRYEGQTRAFDIVPGMRIGGALQMFANRDGLRREFELVYWNRKGRDHLFLKASDGGSTERDWASVDLGVIMKITKPTVSIMPGGEVIVLHRIDADNFLRSEFWSVPQGIQFHSRNIVQDPETAGANRVRELYKEAGGVKPKQNPWWKFW